MDHLFNSNNPNRGSSKSNQENNEKVEENERLHGGKGMSSKEMKEAVEESVNVERKKWENDKERLRNIHAKQLQELKKKIKDWMEYAKKQEQHAKIYRSCKIFIKRASRKDQKDKSITQEHFQGQ